jgi:phosphate transport system permease protein
MSEDFKPETRKRFVVGVIVKHLCFFTLIVGIISLLMLLLNIVNNGFGFVLASYEISPRELIGNDRKLDEVPHLELEGLLKNNLSPGMLRKLEADKPLGRRSREDLTALLIEYVCKEGIHESWNLWDSLFKQQEIREFHETRYPDSELYFRSWISMKFLTSKQSSIPEKSGIRTAILGSLWMVLITMIIAFPLGIATALYLEEYAPRNILTKVIQVNIYNLAGIPSIIYGLFGLTIFVRFLEPVTSGVLFGVQGGATANGRTILAAGLTMALLILPIIIINAQESIRAVSPSLRFSSYGLGATKWQTIRHHVLPGSMDRILTGAILAVSRALGETAPLVVIGASTFITVDPASLFSKFTALPIQIYQWTARPQASFKHVAAAAIIVLVVLLIGLNGFAIILRNHLSAKRSHQS